MASVESAVTPLNNEQKPSETPVHRVADHEGGIHFTPPLYRQRYMFALDMIERDPSLYSLLDIGCGTGQLLTIGKYRNPHIQLVAAIDILRYELDEACFRLKPLPVEYMMYRRETPLHTYIIHGDATKICNCFYHFDVVTLIEVIEHLYINDLESLVEHVFGYIRPRLVIVTTPNADFNVLFSQMPFGQFRHADHKFEFTRYQFNLWAQQIALNYNYLVEFNGVGEAPANEQHRNVGTCTQIAIFYRREPNLELNLTSNELFQRLSYCKQHELISYIDYPYGTKKSIDLHEQVRYILEMYRLMAEDKARHGDDDQHDSYPLRIHCQSLLTHPRLSHSQLTIEDLKHIIEYLGYKMFNDDEIILSNETARSSPSDEHEDNVNSQPNEIIDNDQRTIQHEESWD